MSIHELGYTRTDLLPADHMRHAAGMPRFCVSLTRPTADSKYCSALRLGLDSTWDSAQTEAQYLQLRGQQYNALHYTAV